MVCCSPIPATCTAGHQRIALSSASSMQSWTGYDSSLDFIPDDFLTLESPADWGLPKLRIRPENQQNFFATELPVRITFQTDPDGKVRTRKIYPPRGQIVAPKNRLTTEKKSTGLERSHAGCKQNNQKFRRH